MGNVKSTLSGSITLTDILSNQPVTKSLGSPQLDSAVGDFQTYRLLPVAATDYAQDLPSATVFCVYVKNQAAAGSGQNITIKGTPAGGVEATLCLLPPQACFIYWSPTTAAGGYTGLKLNPSANNIPFDMYLGA